MSDDISADVVMQLRARTNLPMMRCKKALKQAGGDAEKAIEILKSEVEGLKLKRLDNETKEGRIFIKIADDLKLAAMVEIQCETAPVAGSEMFSALGDAITTQLLSNPSIDSIEAVMALPVPGQSTTIQELWDDTINKIGEKFVAARLACVEGPIGSYVHHDGKTAVLFQAEGEKLQDPVLRNVAMHIAGLKPTYATEAELNPADVEAERNRLMEEAKASGKPENILGKIVDGRMALYLSDQGVLSHQPFAMDEKKKVHEVLSAAGYKPKSFILWVLGEK